MENKKYHIYLFHRYHDKRNFYKMSLTSRTDYIFSRVKVSKECELFANDNFVECDLLEVVEGTLFEAETKLLEYMESDNNCINKIYPRPVPYNEETGWKNYYIRKRYLWIQSELGNLAVNYFKTC